MSLSYDRYLKAGDLFVEYDKDQKSNTDYSELYDSNKLGMLIKHAYMFLLYYMFVLHYVHVTLYSYNVLYLI